MYLDLTDVLRAPGNASEKPLRIEPDTLEGLELAEPVNGTVRATNARQNLVVSGRGRTMVVLPCSRCLQPYQQPVEFELEASAPLSFFRQLTHGIVPEDEEEEPDDELAALFDANSLDVLELVRQAIELQLPPKPLCSPDCPGLPEAAKYMSAPGDDRLRALENWNKKE
jgi:uncharacterized protein